MGQGTINQVSKVGSPIEGILAALQAVHAYYGIDTQKAQQKLLASEAAQKDLAVQKEAERNDPNSNASKLAQAQSVAELANEEKQGVVIPNKSVMLDAIQGHPVRFAEFGADQAPGPAVPGMSAADLDANKEGTPLSKLTGEMLAARSRQAGFQFRDDQLKERQDFQAHQKNLAKLKGDAQLGQMVTNYNNLQTGLNNLDRMGTATKQDYEDLQNLVISNMGVKGQGGVAERAKRYAESLGMNGEGLVQFLTGKPQDVSQGNPLFDRYKEVAQMELGNFQNRISKRVDALTSGNRSVYERRPDLKGDLADAVNMTTGQLVGNGQQPTQAAAPTSGGPSAQATPQGFDLVSAAKAELARRQKTTASTQ